MSADPLLRAEGLTRVAHEADGAAERSALFHDLSLSVDPGDRVALVGASGSGKTLFLRSLAGLDPLDSGRVYFRGRPMNAYEMPEYRAHVAYVHQRPVVLGATVEDDLRRVYSFRVHRGREYDSNFVVRNLRRMGREPESFLGKDSDSLSGGEQQLVAFLRVIQLEPHVLLLDEPTAALDAELARKLEDLVSAWLSDHPDRACLWVTHDPAQAGRIADRRVRMERGRLTEEAM